MMLAYNWTMIVLLMILYETTKTPTVKVMA